MTESSKFLEKLAQRRAEEAAKELSSSPLDVITLAESVPTIDDAFMAQFADCIPDVETPEARISEQERTLDEFMRLIPIAEAYRRWGGKSEIRMSRKKEVKASCPNPAHPDKDPSFVMNTEKNVFNCFKCGGGDIYDIAAWHKGYPVPGYKAKEMFRDLKAEMARDYGMEIVYGVAGDSYVVSASDSKPDVPAEHAREDATPEVESPTESEPKEKLAEVIYTPLGANKEVGLEEEIAARRKYASIDWRSIIPANTFMRAYMDEVSRDDCPEEYHFWSSLVAVGLAAGRGRVLQDSPPVSANLFVCYTGPSGTGKSKAKRWLTETVAAALPYDASDAIPTGVRRVKNAQSGEVIVSRFKHEIIDPVTGKSTGSFLPVKLLVDSEELAGIVGRASRQGSTLKDVLMDMYDCKADIESASLANPLKAEMPFGSVITSTQNRSVRELITKADAYSGFINRWVFATGVPKEPFSINRVEINTIRAQGLLKLINRECQDFKVVTWDDDAEQTWDAFFREHIVPLKISEDNDTIQRIDLLLKKLFLLFTVNRRETVVSKNTVEVVLSLYPYLRETYQIIEEQVAATEASDNESFVLKKIEQMSTRSQGPSARELHQVVKRKVSDSKQLRNMLENFVVLGLIQELARPPGPSGGRPTKFYIYTGGRSA